MTPAAWRASGRSSSPWSDRRDLVLVAGALWWLDLAQREAFNFIEAFAISASAVALPIFAAFLLAGLGYGLRLFALYVASRAQ